MLPWVTTRGKERLAPARPWNTAPFGRVTSNAPQLTPPPRCPSSSPRRNANSLTEAATSLAAGQKPHNPPARFARPRGPTLSHRIYRQNQHETVTPCNPKNHSHCAPPPPAVTATRKFPRIPANPIPTTTSRPSGTQNPQPGVRFRPARRYNQPEPTIRPTRSAPPRQSASVRAAPRGATCTETRRSLGKSPRARPHQARRAPPKESPVASARGNYSLAQRDLGALALFRECDSEIRTAQPITTAAQANRHRQPPSQSIGSTQHRPRRIPSPPPARSARPRGPTSPHRIHRQNPARNCNPK